jgi:cation-transporting ATPase E
VNTRHQDGGKIEGLSERQVAARRSRGEQNVFPSRTGRSYLQILRKNAFTFINTVLFAIGAVLVLMGHIGDAVVTAGLVLLNVVVGVVQEGRAKRKLDRIALLTRPKATVLREGEERTLDPQEVVLGDTLVARPGDQIVVDGALIGEARVEVDESLLTGESERVQKSRGDVLYSGTFCASGTAVYEALKVGPDALINQMTKGARAFRQVKTPLQKEVDLVIRVLVMVVSVLGVLLAISFFLHGVPVVEGVQAAAVIVALVPQGLFFMTTVAYAMGVLRVAGKGALIQEANAVESCSHVDLLCLDKTGTLTTNRVSFRDKLILDDDWKGKPGELDFILGAFARSSHSGDRTTEALREALEGQARPVLEEVPFSSEYRWSGLAFDDGGMRGVYLLGAPEVLTPHLAKVAEVESRADALSREGLRVLLFAHLSQRVELRDSTGRPRLPDDLDPLCLLSFREELRPEARETLEHFHRLGVELKIISGDNPQTVASLARQVGLGLKGEPLSGVKLGDTAEEQLRKLAEEATVFGRITPQQKQMLIDIFRDDGHYVAMIGDGVNDVLSLKEAHLGVAMQGGSQAARSVADIVLLGDSFGSLPIALREGQRIVRGMEDVIRLLLTRTLYVMLLIVATQIVGVAFPVTPKHNSILALVTVGIPIFAIAAWAQPGATPRSVLRSVSRFVWPSSITIAILALGVYLYYLAETGDISIARSALTTVTVFCGLLLIPFVEPPTQFWVAGDELSGDWRPSALALGMLGVYGSVMAVPALRKFFELTTLSIGSYLGLGLVAVAWAFLIRSMWRYRLFERVLQID